ARSGSGPPGPQRHGGTADEQEARGGQQGRRGRTGVRQVVVVTGLRAGLVPVLVRVLGGLRRRLLSGPLGGLRGRLLGGLVGTGDGDDGLSRGLATVVTGHRRHRDTQLTSSSVVSDLNLERRLVRRTSRQRRLRAT